MDDVVRDIPPPGASTQALERGLTVLSALAGRSGALGLVEISKASGLSKSTCHRYLTALVRLDYVEQDRETRRYRLGPAAAALSAAAHGSREVVQVAGRMLQELSEETNQTASLAVLDGTDIVYVDRRRPTRAGFQIQLDLHVGSRLPAYCTALGKVLLAHRDPVATRRALDRMDLIRRGPGTITSREELLTTLQTIERVGLAVANEELAPGVRALAVPVRDRFGETIAAVGLAVHLGAWNATLAAVTDRFELPLRRTGRDISQRMGYLP